MKFELYLAFFSIFLNPCLLLLQANKHYTLQDVENIDSTKCEVIYTYLDDKLNQKIDWGSKIKRQNKSDSDLKACFLITRDGNFQHDTIFRILNEISNSESFFYINVTHKFPFEHKNKKPVIVLSQQLVKPQEKSYTLNNSNLNDQGKHRISILVRIKIQTPQPYHFSRGLYETLIFDILKSMINISSLLSTSTYINNRILKRSLNDLIKDEYDYNALLSSDDSALYSGNQQNLRNLDIRQENYHLLDSYNVNGSQSVPFKIDRKTQVLHSATFFHNGNNSNVNQNNAINEMNNNNVHNGSSKNMMNSIGAFVESQQGKSNLGGFPPSLRRPLDQHEVAVGKYFSFPIPYDTFYDYIDGNTPNLKLTLYTIDKIPLNEDGRYNWIKLDSRLPPRIYGIPTTSDLGLHQLMLAAYNKRGISVYNAFTVFVHNRPKGFRSLYDEGVNHRFWISMDAPSVNYTEYRSRLLGNKGRYGNATNRGGYDFKSDLDSQINFLSKLLNYYYYGNNSNILNANPVINTSLSQNIYIDSIEKGSVRVNWINDTLLTPDKLSLEAFSDYIKEKGYNYSRLQGCPYDSIKKIASKFVRLENSNNNNDDFLNKSARKFAINPDFQKAMGPDYKVKKAGYELLHSCYPFKPAPLKSVKQAGNSPVESVSSNHERSIWLTTIIPALVMALLLLLAGLIACCLYRRTHKPRFTTEDDKALFRKGIPVVIYPQEFQDNPNNIVVNPTTTNLIQYGGNIANAASPPPFHSAHSNPYQPLLQPNPLTHNVTILSNKPSANIPSSSKQINYNNYSALNTD
ncbi:unnamed protein product [Gordionus sp. m RMFG-2023]